MSGAREMVLCYLGNRADFYNTLLERIPYPQFRDWLQEAVSPIESSAEFLDMIRVTSITAPSGDFFEALALRDELKKPSFGRSFGRTAVSFEEALSRAERMELSGLILFRALAEAGGNPEAFEEEANRRQQALTRVIRLGDDLRYHRLSLSACL